jgi:hypothetical protein
MLCARIGVIESTKGQIRTLTWRWICYGGNGGEDSIDGDGDQWQGVAGDDGDDLETRGSSAGARARAVEVICNRTGTQSINIQALSV